jgi:hypothetical protein
MNACHCDYEPARVYRASRPRARQAYTCDECGSVIESGETYERVYALWDGLTFGDVLRTCCDCLAVRDALALMDCFCWSHRGLWESDIPDHMAYASFRPGVRFAILRQIAAHRARR